MILILGGGLAGLSTAFHLRELPHLVLEAEATAGGLCRSRNIDGFTFDYTGHLLHLRDSRAVALVDELLPEQWNVIERRAVVRTHGVNLSFPFQANLHGLPSRVVADYLIDFIKTLSHDIPGGPDTSFKDWAIAAFGKGIAEHFLLPYNEKLFCVSADKMTADWVSWAVPRPSVDEIVHGAFGVVKGMGYNSVFRYPKQGGIGTLAHALANKVDRLRVNARVAEIDLARRTVTIDDGVELSWDHLVVTVPLPTFLKTCRGLPIELVDCAERLKWNVVACLNLGIDRSDMADGAHWIYFPDKEVPFYRVGIPSNFSNTVSPPRASSMYVEFGMPQGAVIDSNALERQALEALMQEGIIDKSDRILTRDFVRIEPAYVIFDRERQEVMGQVRSVLSEMGVELIGRYGAWTYSYMERALLDGMELAERFRSSA